MSDTIVTGLLPDFFEFSLLHLFTRYFAVNLYLRSLGDVEVLMYRLIDLQIASNRHSLFLSCQAKCAFIGDHHQGEKV